MYVPEPICDFRNETHPVPRRACYGTGSYSSNFNMSLFNYLSPGIVRVQTQQTDIKKVSLHDMRRFAFLFMIYFHI